MNDAHAELDRRAALAALGLTGLAAATAAAAQPGQPGQPQRRPDRPLPNTPVPQRPGQQPVGPAPALTPEQLGWNPQRGEYVLPPLPYPANALEPHIDAQTMEIHHGKHHQGYVDGLNRALGKLAEIRNGQGDQSLVKFWSGELAFNGSGHANHTLFWLTMAPAGQGGGGEPQGAIGEAFDRDFGSFKQFSEHFKQAARTVEGSGWGWLVYHPMSDRLMVLQGEKQQDQTIWGSVPLMGVDVWEHAYYLKYQNRRSEYVDAFMNVINWGRVNDLYAHARRMSRLPERRDEEGR